MLGWLHPVVLSGSCRRFDFTAGLPNGVTYARSGAAGALTVDGRTTAFAADRAPVTDRGLLIEAGRTNRIRANTAATYWNGESVAGIGYAYATGVENGAAWVDVRMSGINASGGTAYPQVNFETAGHLSASEGQVWTLGFGYRLAAGSLAGVNYGGILPNINDYNGGGVVIAGTGAFGPLDGTLRQVEVHRTSAAGTASINVNLAVEVPAGASIDLTVRVYMVQLEEGSTRTSAIPTSGTATTRGLPTADVIAQSANWSAVYGASATIATGTTATGAAFDLVTGRPWVGLGNELRALAFD